MYIKSNIVDSFVPNITKMHRSMFKYLETSRAGLSESVFFFVDIDNNFQSVRRLPNEQI